MDAGVRVGGGRDVDGVFRFFQPSTGGNLVSVLGASASGTCAIEPKRVGVGWFTVPGISGVSGPGHQRLCPVHEPGFSKCDHPALTYIDGADDGDQRPFAAEKTI